MVPATLWQDGPVYAQWIAGEDRETKAETKPLRNLLGLQPLNMCSSADKGQAPVDKASWSLSFSPKDAVRVPHPETTA